jgi:hypothetical protein
VERVCLGVIAANDLSRLVESHGPGQAHLYRLLARTRPIGDVMRAVDGCPADLLPIGLGLVVQEACLGLSPLLGVLDAAEPSDLSPNALATLQAQISAFRCWRYPPSGDSFRAIGEHLCAAWRARTSPRESRFLLVVGLLFGWSALAACLRPCFVHMPLITAYEALLQLTRLDAKVDHLASLVPDLLAIWPPARPEPGCLEQVGLETLLVAVDLLGEAGAPLARYSRTEEHSLHIFLWLRRLGAALLHSPPSLQHLACSPYVPCCVAGNPPDPYGIPRVGVGPHHRSG